MSRLKTPINPLLLSFFSIFLTFIPTEAYCDKCDYLCKDCNVILISFDTLRADALGVYGNKREVSPEIDKFANNSTIYNRAYSTSCKTAPSHMSIFTSLLASAHGVTNVEEKKRRAVKLPDNVVTLAEILKKNGYKTAGFHGGGFVSKEFGFNQGFDKYKWAKEDKISLVENWIKGQKAGKFFLFYHSYRMHDPYLLPKKYERQFNPEYSGKIVANRKGLFEIDQIPGQIAKLENAAFYKSFWDRVDPDSASDLFHLRALYDTQLLFVDQLFSRILTSLKKVRNKSIVIFLSDHGEEFMEHGKFRHDQIYNESLHVPLIVSHPNCWKGTQVDRRVSLLGLAPSILKLLGIPPHSQHQGTPFIPPTKLTATQKIFAEFNLAKHYMLIKNDQKLLLKGEPLLSNVWGREFYNLIQDPKEKKNIYDTAPGVKDLKRTLKENLHSNGVILERNRKAASSEGKSSDAPLNPETVERLKSLGYLK